MAGVRATDLRSPEHRAAIKRRAPFRSRTLTGEQRNLLHAERLARAADLPHLQSERTGYLHLIAARAADNARWARMVEWVAGDDPVTARGVPPGFVLLAVM